MFKKLGNEKWEYSFVINCNDFDTVWYARSANPIYKFFTFKRRLSNQSRAIEIKFLPYNFLQLGHFLYFETRTLTKLEFGSNIKTKNILDYIDR